MREPTQSVPWIPRRRSSDGEDGALAIRSVRPEGRRGFESWLMRYGAPYKWRDATKVLVILTALSFIAGLFTLCCLFLRGWPVLWGASPTILRYATWFALGYTGVALLLTARAWLHRRDEAPAPVAVIVAVFFQAIVNGSFAYVAGPFTAAGAYALMTGVMLALVLVDRWLAYASIGVWVATVLAADVLSRQGWLPFRPLFLDTLGAHAGALSAMDYATEIFRGSVTSVIFGGFAIYLADAVLRYWRRGDEMIEQAARVDALTGVLTRHHMMKVVEAKLDESLRTGSPLSLVMVDIDHFKKINDKFGHHAGDVVLKRTASLLSETIRATDAIGRFGGEEFLVVLPDTAVPGALVVAERCRAAMHELAFDALPRVKVTASFGIAAFPEHGDEVDALFDGADYAMYRAKRAGRDRVLVYDEAEALARVSAVHDPV